MEDLVKVQCILETGYNDKDLGEFIDKNRIYYVTEERARLLEEKGAAKRIDEKMDDIDIDNLDVDDIDKLEAIEAIKEVEEPKKTRRKRKLM